MSKTTTAKTLFDLDQLDMDQYVRDGDNGSDIYSAIAMKYWPLIDSSDNPDIDDPGEFEKALVGLLNVELTSAVLLNEIGVGEMCDYEVRCMLDSERDNLPPSANVIEKLKVAQGAFDEALQLYLSELEEPIKKTGIEVGNGLRANSRFILLMAMNYLSINQVETIDSNDDYTLQDIAKAMFKNLRLGDQGSK